TTHLNPTNGGMHQSERLALLGGLGGLGGDAAVVEECTESEERLDGRCGARAVFIEHRALGGAVAAEQRPDQQAVMLIELLRGGIRRAMKLDEPLLAAAAEERAVQGWIPQCWFFCWACCCACCCSSRSSSARYR